MKSLHYMRDRDQVIAQLVTEEGKHIYQYRYICFGNLRSTYFTNELLKPEAKYLDFYFTSSLERLRKSKSGTFMESFMDALTPTGIFRNAEVTSIAWWDIPSHPRNILGGYFSNYKAQKECFFRVRFDIDKVSSPEMFLVGNIFRCLHLHPYVIYDFLRLLKKHPDVCPFEVFMIAHLCRLRKNRALAVVHSIVSNWGLYIQHGIKDVLNRLDEDYKLNGCLRITPNYSRLIWDEYLMAFSFGNFSIAKGSRYSAKIFKSYLNKEDFGEALKTIPKNILRVSNWEI